MQATNKSDATQVYENTVRASKVNKAGKAPPRQIPPAPPTARSIPFCLRYSFP